MMNTPDKCQPSGFNLSRVEGNKQMRVICAWMDPIRKKILEDLLSSVGGIASHGICEGHCEQLTKETREEIGEVLDEALNK